MVTSLKVLDDPIGKKVTNCKTTQKPTYNLYNTFICKHFIYFKGMSFLTEAL